MPSDGGLYVPCDTEDLRHWILYADENTSFANLAGTLTSALINKEFSPIICETIATTAFYFEPQVKQLGQNLFVLELFHGPTGTFKDFGVSYLAAALETILRYNDEKAILLDATTGNLGASLATALRGKKLVKSVLLYPKGKVYGLEESDLVWNGGNYIQSRWTERNPTAATWLEKSSPTRIWSKNTTLQSLTQRTSDVFCPRLSSTHSPSPESKN